MRLYTSELVKKYKSRTVVDHVSIDVNQGEIVGLLGPNGAGKTTTFYMIVGLIKPNEGRIFLENDEGQVSELTSLPVYRRAQLGVGYLAQEASVFRRLTVEENIRAVLEMTEYSKEYQNERVEALIEEFRLQKVRKSLGIQLSGGERRRTEIARAVAINPAFILLDEPFAGVDPIAVEDIQSIVATLKHKNIGVIITDHNVDETLAITDRTYLLYEGKILKTGTAEELAADPMVRKVYLGQHFELKKSHQLTQEMKNRKGEELRQMASEEALKAVDEAGKAVDEARKSDEEARVAVDEADRAEAEARKAVEEARKAVDEARRDKRYSPAVGRMPRFPAVRGGVRKIALLPGSEGGVREVGSLPGCEGGGRLVCFPVVRRGVEGVSRPEGFPARRRDGEEADGEEAGSGG